MHDHYYLIINAEGISTIKVKEAPGEAARYAYALDKESYSKVWHVSKGQADHHYLAYEFRFNGPVTGRMAHVVDLGPVNAYEEPGLSAKRKIGGPGARYVPEPVEDLLTVPDDPCAHCWRGDGYDALVEHHKRHHEGVEGCGFYNKETLTCER